MAFDIKMPQLSDTMNAGKILAWKKQVGDKVKRGDVLAEVETEKANLEIESFYEGTLLKVMVSAQSSAKVGEVIAVVGAVGEGLTVAGSGQSGADAKTSVVAGPTTSGAAVANSGAPLVASPTTSVLPVTSSSIAVNPQGRVKASPLARKLAQSRNIDLKAIQGTGPDGRIVKRDIDGAAGSSAQIQASPNLSVVQPTGASPIPVTVGSGKLTPFTKMRETIARRMQESVNQSPHFYVTTSIDMRAAVKLRENLKERTEFKGISINHLIIKAAAYALAQEPRVNCAVKDNQVFEPEQINIGIITAIEGGLLIPVIKEANTLPLKDLVFEARAAVDRARAGRPSSSDLLGGTFSISNMGMFDVESFTAIINPGQGAVLAVSSVMDEAIVENGVVVAGKRMRATLSVDHRIIDGVMAGTFQKHFKQALELPALLLL